MTSARPLAASGWKPNGLGGFSFSTIVDLNTRRYHALPVLATKPPVGRPVLLSKLEETLFIIDGQPFDLSANRYFQVADNHSLMLLGPQLSNHREAYGSDPLAQMRLERDSQRSAGRPGISPPAD